MYEDLHKLSEKINITSLITLTRWVCFNDPAWESSGWVGWGGFLGDIPTTYIQLAQAGSMKKSQNLNKTEYPTEQPQRYSTL